MFDYLFDIAVLGSENVGKKTFAKSKFLDNSGDIDQMRLIGMEFALKTVKIEDTIVKLFFRILSREQRWWDNTRKIHLGIHIRHLHGAIILYDITNPESLELIPQWIQFVKDNAGEVPILLVGNKLDLKEQRKISKEQVEKIKKMHEVDTLMEISVNSGENVEKMISNLTSLILNHYEVKFELNNKRDHFMKLITSVINEEKDRFQGKKNLKKLRKSWRKSDAGETISFEDYLNNQKEILFKLTGFRKDIFNAKKLAEMLNVVEKVKKIINPQFRTKINLSDSLNLDT